MKALLLLLIASVTMAGVVVTDTPGLYELRDSTGVVKDSAGKVLRYASYDLCKAGAVEIFGQRSIQSATFTCVHSGTAIAITANCDGVPPPAPVVDAEGFTDVGTLEGHLCPGSDERWELSVTRPVAAPFPKCWEVKPVVEFACDAVPPFLMDLDNDDPGLPWPIESAPPGEPGTPVDFE